MNNEVAVCDPRTQLAEKIRTLSSKARFNEASREELFELSTLAHEAADLYDQLYGPPGEYKLVERFASRDIGLSIGDVLMAMSAGGGNGIHIKVTRTGISRAGFEEADFAAVTTGPFTGPSHMSSNDPKGLWEHLRGHGWRRLSRERVCYCGASPTLECRCETCTNPSASRQWGNYVTGELTRAFLCCDNHISEVSARHRHVYDGTEANWRLAQTPAEPMLMSAEAAEVVANSSNSYEPREPAQEPTKLESAWATLVDALDELSKKHRGNGQHDYNLSASLHALCGLAKELRAKALAGVTPAAAPTAARVPLCGKCGVIARYTCGCRRCASEPDDDEKYHTCNLHKTEVGEQHERVRERVADWCPR